MTHIPAIRLYVLLSAVALAQPTPPDGDGPKVEEAPRPASLGLFPTPQLVDLMLRRWANDVSAQYDLDEQQRDKLTEAVSRRWGSFFEKNRGKMEPLFNEFMEMRLRVEAPDEKRMRDWAARASPMLARVRQHVDEGMSEFRDVLEPHQLAQFEERVKTFRGRLDEASSWLGRLESGDFEGEDLRGLWESSGERAERRRQRRAAADHGKETESPKDRVEIELDTWRAYVESFVTTNDLDQGQRDAALSCFSEIRLRAIAHRDRQEKEIESLERRIEIFDGSDAQFAELKKKLEELYGPFDVMFAELERRLETILTVEQKARLAQSKAEERNKKDVAEQTPDE